VKHAFAAAELYSKARWLVSHQSAEWAVNGLGELNERVEQHVKHDRDVSPEVYKDLRNNVYGIVAARWLREKFDRTNATTILRLIGWLAKQGELPAYYDDPRLPKLPLRHDAGTAIQLMRVDERGLAEGFAATLDRNRDAIVADLGLVSR
jgi:hypothetical protein